MKQRFFLLYFTFFISIEMVAQVSSYQVVQDMGRGVNLGNTLSAPVEGNWAPIVYEQYFADVKNEGFSNVRIPALYFSNSQS